jgi:hypothetical protein
MLLKDITEVEDIGEMTDIITEMILIIIMIMVCLIITTITTTQEEKYILKEDPELLLPKDRTMVSEVE